MGLRYAENNSALMLLCALLVPVSLFAPTIIISGVAIVAFILIKVVMLANFFSQDDFEFEHKMLLLAIIVGSFYMLSMVIAGRSLLMEALGLLLALGYLILAGILVFSTTDKRKTSHTELKESELSVDEIDEFRKLDEAENLYTVQELRNQKHLTDYDDFKKPKTEWKTIEPNQTQQKYSKFANDGYYEIKHDEEYNTDGYLELYPTERQKQVALDKKFEKTVSISQEPKVQVVNIKDAQTNVMDDLHKLKSDIMQFDEGVKTIDEKIRIIAERAILEGAQKKLQMLAKHEKTKHQKESKAVIDELKSEKHILEKAQRELESLSQKHETKTTSKINISHKQNALEQLQKELELLEKSQESKKIKVRAPAHITAQKSAMEKLNRELKEFEYNRLLREKKELEQAQKKLQAIKTTKQRPKRIDLFASNTGNKYHYDRRCLTLKKVNKKDILKFKNVEAARKKGLKACGLCKKK